MPNVIGITGLKRSGKDTIADHLVWSHGYKKYRFADPLKEACRAIFLWDDEWIEGEKKETVDPRWGISPRQAMQLVGTELFRKRLPELSSGFNDVTGDSIWVNRFKYFYTGGKLVVSDVRFLNEAQAIRDVGGVIIRVIRDERSGVHIEDKHSSEKELALITEDYTIYNNGSFEDLYREVEKIV